MLKSNLSDVFLSKYTKIKISSDDDLPLDKTLNMYYVVKLIRSFLIKDHNHYYYETCFENCSYK